MATVLKMRFLVRSRTAAEWTALNEVLLASTEGTGARELGMEEDTGRFKLGDGATRWNDLPYTPSNGLPPGGTTGQTLVKKSDDDGDGEWVDAVLDLTPGIGIEIIKTDPKRPVVGALSPEYVAGATTLVAGAATVNTPAVDADSLILLTVQSLGTVTTPKAMYISAKVPGTSFTIKSVDATDTSVVGWMVLQESAGSIWRYVKSLLHFDGYNGSAVFIDQKGPLWSVSGTAAISTTKSVFGGASLRSTGRDSRLSCTTSLIPSNTAFTIQAWVSVDSLTPPYGGHNIILSQGKNVGNGDQFISIASDGKFTFYRGSGVSATAITGLKSTTVVTPDTFYLVELGYSGGVFYLFVNGVLENTLADTLGWIDTGLPFQIGSESLASYASFRLGFSGYIDDLRVVAGVCLHTAGYDLPTEAFPNR